MAIKRKINLPLTKKDAVWTTVSIPAEIKRALNKICVLREISSTETVQNLVVDWMQKEIAAWEAENPQATLFDEFKAKIKKAKK